jgi:EAL domain-containing protein (putative c-di-GMP-specific phosphodiesterase class I)
MDTIAEGVEFIDQVAQLQALGCAYAQGYLFAKPLPAQAIVFPLLEGSLIYYAPTGEILNEKSSS